MLRLFYYLLSGLYGMAVLTRNLLYDLKVLRSVEFDVPVISIGNITVGGTGKTPHSEYLIKLLKENFRVAVLSRGYKRRTKGFRIVETTSSVRESGDEPLQMKLRFPRITVSVCENRVKGIKKLLKKEDPPEVILLDDAFQHRRIIPGVNILLIDYSRPLKKDYLLPAGRLREGSIQKRRAHIILITKCPDDILPMTKRVIKIDLKLHPYQDLYFTTLSYGHLLPVFTAAKKPDLFFELNQAHVLVVTGIATPDSIISYVSKSAKKIETLIFPDHHYFSPGDISKILSKFESLNSCGKIILTTEKDAVRFRELKNIPAAIAENLYYLPVRIRFLDKEGKDFDQKILSYVGKNKNIRELYKKDNK